MKQLWRNQLNNRLVTSGLNDSDGNSEFEMTNALAGEADKPKKKSKLPLLIGLVLAIALGSGSFYAVYSSKIFGGAPKGMSDASQAVSPMPDVAFVPVEPVIISLGQGAANRHLKFTAQVEVEAAHAADVTILLPRIQDVFNSYLSAVEPGSLEESAAIVRVRAQLLRRVQIVVGEGRVRDLLITEFVLN
jgi:flagellar protein FliL